MPYYVNEKCPVCEKPFDEHDDIVTCPYCGTPHHRECYNSLGHCANEDKHGEDFSFKPSVSESAVLKSEGSAKIGEYYQPNMSNSNSDGKAKCVNCGEELEDSAVFCNKCGARQPAPRLSSFSNPPMFSKPTVAPEKPRYKDDESIEGVKLNEIASIIRSNAERFVNIFKSGKRISWNWGAFVFGPYYLFFRKMYKEGALFLALRLTMSLINQGVHAKEYNAFASFVVSNLDALRNPTQELAEQLMPLYEAILPFMLIQLGGMLLINIIIALFADNIYKDRVITIAKKVNQKLDEGGHFGQTIGFFDTESQLTQEEMKSLYLSKLGGTSIFAPLFAYLVYDLVTSFIAKL